MPPRRHKGALVILLVGATASFLDKFTSREEFTVGELRKIRRDHCKGVIPRARRESRDDAAAAARTYLPESWPRERSCEPVAIRRWAWVGRLIFLLIIGETGRTPPHVFLDQRFGGPADVW